MSSPDEIVLKIISSKGTYAAGHYKDQTFDLSNDFILGFSGEGRAICSHAFHVLYPSWQVLRNGGRFPWEEGHGRANIACPDPFNPLMMELQRLDE